jgi:hypothetical protein
MKRTVLLSMIVMLFFTFLSAEKVVFSRVELGITIEEANTTYKSGPTIVTFRNTKTNQVITVPAVWQDGNLIVDWSNDKGLILKRLRTGTSTDGMPTWLLDDLFPPQI